ncbi:MAG: FAD-dependent oxidoreductase, partial [Planctomycetes bacterium]|nr:FAD-dependent oxidoreductase [Planctomycetota bacterium]
MKSQANSVSKQVDLAIVGGGLAGCAMAWQATLRGLQVAMIDRCAQETSSRVAAGLVTPITGSRLALSWRYIEFFTQADAFYNAAQRSLDESFWTVAPALRLFSSKDERDLFEARWCVDDPMATGPSIRVDRLTSQDLSGFEAPLGGFLMSPAGRLNT